MEHYKETGKVHSLEWVSSHLTCEWWKIKESNRHVASAFNNFFITITEKWNIQQTQKGDAISILKDSSPGNFPSIKIIPITDAEMKSIIHSLKPNK